MKSLGALSLVMLLAGVAGATPDNNGRDINGRDINGRDINGRDINGRDINGLAMTGTTVESGTILTTWVGGVKKTGTELIGANLQVAGDSSSYDLHINSAAPLAWPNQDVWSYAVSGDYWQWGCTHYGYNEGVRLDAQCSNVEGAVCAYDSYCCTTRWDSQCVSEWWTEYNRAQSNGQGWYYSWHRHHEDSICGQDGDEDGMWYSWRPLRKGIFVGGTWNAQAGVPGGGSKSESGMSFACLPSPNRRGGGAIAKCVTNGYKPWQSASKNELHQACVRTYRADFCGDGMSWTENGNPIDIYDSRGILSQDYNSGWKTEAVWKGNGARLISDQTKMRTTTSPGTGGRTLQQYIDWKRQTYGATYCPLSIAPVGTTQWGGCYLCDEVYTKIP